MLEPCIYNDNDYKAFWYLLRELMADIENGEREDTPKLRDRIATYKKTMREYLRNRQKHGRFTPAYNWNDTIVNKFYLPDSISNIGEAERYFDEWERIVPPSSPYDCTGEQFTTWHRIFYVKGRYLCYHAVAIDV